MGNAANIIQGSAIIYLDGIDIGYTNGGVTVRYSPEYNDIMPDQAVGNVRKFRTSEKMFVTFNLLEPTLDLLRKCWNQPLGNISGSYYYLGYNDSCSLNEHTLALIGKNGMCSARTFYFYKVMSINETSYAMSRENPTEIEVEFECLKDSANNDRFGWMANLYFDGVDDIPNPSEQSSVSSNSSGSSESGNE